MHRPDAKVHCPLLPHTARGAPCAESGWPDEQDPGHWTPGSMYLGQLQTVFGDSDGRGWLGQGAAYRL